MTAADTPRTVNVAGLPLPLRETIVALVTTFALVIDYYHPLALLNWPIGPAASTGIARVGLFLVVPLVTLLLLRERPSEYGLRLGDWRIGLAVAIGLATAGDADRRSSPPGSPTSSSTTPRRKPGRSR